MRFYFPILLFLVNRRGVEDGLRDKVQFETRAGGGFIEVVQLAVKAAFVAVMTGRVSRAALLDFYKKHVLVAVGVEFFHPLHVAGLLALAPKLVAGAAPVGGLLRLQRVAE